MTWQEFLAEIAKGDKAIEVADSGIPKAAVNLPFYELMQIVEALTTGYNKNVQRVRILRSIGKDALAREMEHYWKIEEGK